MINSLCSVYIIIIINLVLPTKEELYRSISDVVQLLETQKSIVNHLEVFVSKEEQKLTTLKRYLDTFKIEYQIAVANVTSYLGNPINAFRLIKRLTVDIKDINQTIENGKEDLQNILRQFKDLEYPSERELKGAVYALARLQSKNRLDCKTIAEGKMNKDLSTVPLTPSDCFIIGRMLYNAKSHKRALCWFLIGLEKLRANPYTDHVLETDFIGYIATYNFTNKNPT